MMPPRRSRLSNWAWIRGRAFGGGTSEVRGSRPRMLWSAIFSTGPSLGLTIGAVIVGVEAVLVILLKQVDARNPVGVGIAVLIGAALLANFVAGVAAARAAVADRRRQAEPPAELARPMPPRHSSADEISPQSRHVGFLSLVLPRRAPSIAAGIVVATAAIAVETLLVLLLQRQSPGEAFEPIYLLGVLVISTVWGLGLAVTMSLASAFVLTYFRHWPAGHFAPFDFQNGVVIVVFLVVALCTNFVAGQARAREIEADHRRREAEVAAALLTESRDILSVLAAQQEALRRVATLVARGASPSQVFTAVAEEMVRCLDVDNADVFRYEADSAAIVVVASHSQHGVRRLTVGERLTLEGDNVPAMVLRTRRAARMDNYEGAAGALAARIRELGLHTRVGAPIVVDERVWGMAVIGSSRPEPLPPDTEQRIADFADLVATALANAATRSELIASRSRIVAAADDARRRLERDLHDGAQQRLVSIGLQARLAEGSVLPEQTALKKQLSELVSGLTAISTELQDTSRGIHPAILSEGGLGPALKSLARRSTVPVTFKVAIQRRLPDSVEVAAYYVVAEALTNAAKHAQASDVNVHAETNEATLYLSIRDDGIGGADFGRGSGLMGLKDRVEALGGQMRVASPPGGGTSLRIAIPLDG
jgi:signal transduction histidine kinase